MDGDSRFLLVSILCGWKVICCRWNLRARIGDGRTCLRRRGVGMRRVGDGYALGRLRRWVRRRQSMQCWGMEGTFLLREGLGDRRNNLNWILRQRDLMIHLTVDQLPAILIVDGANLGYSRRNFLTQLLVATVVGHDYRIRGIGRLLQNMPCSAVILVEICCYTPAPAK